jgi:N-acetylmuramoyl-L-alanine amidase
MNELRFNLRDIEKVVLYGGRTGKKAAEVFAELKPDYLINGGMFSMTGEHRGLTVCDTIIDAQIINGGNYTDKGIAWDDNDLCPEQTSSAKRRGYEYFLGGSPSLVWHGTILVDGKGFSNWFLNTAESIRIGMGINDDELIFCFPEKEMKLPDFAKMMRDAGCKHAINLDGGGSTSILQNQNGQMVALNKRTEDRACSTWLGIFLNETAKQKEVDNMSKVFIGVGHGGSDPGAVSNGLKEAEMNLPIALACRDELVRHGVSVKMSREKNENDPVADEVAECNKFNPDYAVDFHLNAGGGDGFEVFHHFNGGKGKTLAANIEAEVVKIGQNSRGLKTKVNTQGKDYFGFIRQTNAPAIIVECAFIDSKDVQIVDTAAEQATFGKAVARGILKTLGIAVKAEPAKAGAVPSSNFPESWKWIGPEGIGVMDGKNPTKAISREQFAEVLFRMHKKGFL